MRFGTLDYKNVTGHLNFYYRNYNRIPFDAKISYGEYLAGDEGITIDLSRSFANGTKFGIFASFTDVSTEQFGEGSFDKGIYFLIFFSLFEISGVSESLAKEALSLAAAKLPIKTRMIKR